MHLHTLPVQHWSLSHLAKSWWYILDPQGPSVRRGFLKGCCMRFYQAEYVEQWGLHRRGCLPGGGASQEGWGALEPWVPPAPTYPAPSKATQPPLASNFTGFWQILFRQVLRAAAGRANSKALYKPNSPPRPWAPRLRYGRQVLFDFPSPSSILRKQTRDAVYL